MTPNGSSTTGLVMPYVPCGERRIENVGDSSILIRVCMKPKDHDGDHQDCITDSEGKPGVEWSR